MNGKTGLVMSLVAFGVGSAVMYYWDPTNGKRRRDHARRVSRHTIRKAQKFADETTRQLDKVRKMDWQDAAKILVPVAAKALVWR